MIFIEVEFNRQNTREINVTSKNEQNKYFALLSNRKTWNVRQPWSLGILSRVVSGTSLVAMKAMLFHRFLSFLYIMTPFGSKYYMCYCAGYAVAVFFCNATNMEESSNEYAKTLQYTIQEFLKRNQKTFEQLINKKCTYTFCHKMLIYAISIFRKSRKLTPLMVK